MINLLFDKEIRFGIESKIYPVGSNVVVVVGAAVRTERGQTRILRNQRIGKVVYPSGDYESISYHGYGLPYQKTVWDPNGLAQTITYEYDKFGKVSKIKYPNYHPYAPNISEEPEYGCISYDYTTPAMPYDHVGIDRTVGEYGMVRKIIDGRTDPNQWDDGRIPVYTFKYDLWTGGLMSYTTPDGITISYDYNTAWNRKTAVEVNDLSSNTIIYSIVNKYDLAGRMIGVDTEDIATGTMQPVAGFAYDTNGNRGRLTYYTNGSGADPNYYTNYAYNADNLLTHINTAGGSVFSYEAAHSGDIDGLGRLKYASEAIYRPEVGVVTHGYQYQYDMLSELTSVKATNVQIGGNVYDVNEVFAYNKDGNVNRYEYHTKLPNQPETYTADTYVYANGGDIMAGATGNNNPFTLTNDNNGNITKLPTTSANDTVSWNYDNKLKAAQKGTASIAVKYDPMGNRIWRQSTVNGVTTGRKYIVDISGELPVILCEIDDPNSCSPGSLKTSYIYADGQILSQRIHTDPEDPNIFTPYYYVHDRLGSVRLVIDSTGAVVCSYTYKPYGQFYDGEYVENVANPWKFTGQYYDAEIEQYYLRARQYDPVMMRFTGRDPATGQYASPMTLHKYMYCENEPVNSRDQIGLWKEEIHRSFGSWGKSKFRVFDYARLDFDKPATNLFFNHLHFKDKKEAARDVLDAIGDGNFLGFEYAVHGWQDTYTHRDRGWNGWHTPDPSVDDYDVNDPSDVTAYEACNQSTKYYEGLFLKSNIDIWMILPNEVKLQASNPFLSTFDLSARNTNRASTYLESIYKQMLKN